MRAGFPVKGPGQAVRIIQFSDFSLERHGFGAAWRSVAFAIGFPWAQPLMQGTAVQGVCGAGGDCAQPISIIPVNRKCAEHSCEKPGKRQ